MATVPYDESKYQWVSKSPAGIVLRDKQTGQTVLFNPLDGSYTASPSGITPDPVTTPTIFMTPASKEVRSKIQGIANMVNDQQQPPPVYAKDELGIGGGPMSSIDPMQGGGSYADQQLGTPPAALRAALQQIEQARALQMRSANASATGSGSQTTTTGVNATGSVMTPPVGAPASNTQAAAAASDGAGFTGGPSRYGNVFGMPVTQDGLIQADADGGFALDLYAKGQNWNPASGMQGQLAPYADQAGLMSSLFANDVATPGGRAAWDTQWFDNLKTPGAPIITSMDISKRMMGMNGSDDPIYQMLSFDPRTGKPLSAADQVDAFDNMWYSGASTAMAPDMANAYYSMLQQAGNDYKVGLATGQVDPSLSYMDWLAQTGRDPVTMLSGGR